jgi:single-strand DNA-binding protein
MSLANVSIVGNLTRVPEQTFFVSGRTKTTLTVAVNRPDRNKQSSQQASSTADFYKVETWGKLAESAAKFLDKGNQVTVTGRLVLDHWTDKNGKDRVTPVVEANQLAFPPRLRVVSGSDSESHGGGGGATISGEVDVSDPEDNPLIGSFVNEELVGAVVEEEISDPPIRKSLGSSKQSGAAGRPTATRSRRAQSA